MFTDERFPLANGTDKEYLTFLCEVFHPIVRIKGDISNTLFSKIQKLIRLDGYELDKEQTIVCDPYEHTDFNVKFAANSDLCKSLKRKIEHDDYLETALFLTYKVSKIKVYNDDFDQSRNKYKYILTGKIHGNVLFYDLNGLEKYATMLHPNVGDIVTIDFPDETSRE